MEIGSAVNQALIGMQRSQSEMTSSAQQIAQSGTVPATESASSLQIVEPLINIEAQQQMFDSNARVLEAADENVGRLIDTMA